jgi:glycosyltransferase involved in cell wall biosynthesis
MAGDEKLSDIFLRPTRSDGDANSIREALYLGVPVIASDCVERPDQVLTFRTGDIPSYVEIC